MKKFVNRDQRQILSQNMIRISFVCPEEVFWLLMMANTSFESLFQVQFKRSYRFMSYHWLFQSYRAKHFFVIVSKQFLGFCFIYFWYQTDFHIVTKNLSFNLRGLPSLRVKRPTQDGQMKFGLWFDTKFDVYRKRDFSNISGQIHWHNTTKYFHPWLSNIMYHVIHNTKLHK